MRVSSKERGLYLFCLHRVNRQLIANTPTGRVILSVLSAAVSFSADRKRDSEKIVSTDYSPTESETEREMGRETRF